MPQQVADNESRRFNKSINSSNEEEEDGQESLLDSMLKNGAMKQNLMKKRNQALNVKKSKKPANIADIFEKEEEKQEKAFLNNQYWRVPESFSIEDLLQDFE